MLTLKKFQEKYRAQRWVDVDGVFGYQCVDLAKAYLRDCFGIKPGTFGDAIDYYYATVPVILKKFNRIKTTKVKAGDLVIKHKNHIGVATGKQTSTKAEILEQNGHDGTGKKHAGNEIRYRYIDKADIAGVLRPKTVTRAVYYVVRKGDYLSKIAAKYKTTVRALLKLNPKIKNPNVIHPNDKIRTK
jgi:LysM repeat protein